LLKCFICWAPLVQTTFDLGRIVGAGRMRRRITCTGQPYATVSSWRGTNAWRPGRAERAAAVSAEMLQVETKENPLGRAQGMVTGCDMANAAAPLPRPMPFSVDYVH